MRRRILRRYRPQSVAHHFVLLEMGASKLPNKSRSRPAPFSCEERTHCPNQTSGRTAAKWKQTVLDSAPKFTGKDAVAILAQGARWAVAVGRRPGNVEAQTFFANALNKKILQISGKDCEANAMARLKSGVGCVAKLFWH